MSALKDVGLQIPGDIALVGCDNLPFCEMLRPRLSSIDIAQDSPASDIANYFHQMIQGQVDDSSPHLLVKCNLVLRESS